jgi:hypothetical protein
MITALSCFCVLALVVVIGETVALVTGHTL